MRFQYVPLFRGAAPLVFDRLTGQYAAVPKDGDAKALVAEMNRIHFRAEQIKQEKARAWRQHRALSA
jgi:hypothetical protein